jgi:hypothetical protein
MRIGQLSFMPTSPELCHRSVLRQTETSPELRQQSELWSVTVDDLPDPWDISNALAEPSSMTVLGDRAEAEAQVEAQLAEARRLAFAEFAGEDSHSRLEDPPVFQSSFWGRQDRDEVFGTCAHSPEKRSGMSDITNREAWRSPVINLAELESPLTASRPLAPLVMHKRGGGVYGSASNRSASVDVFSPRP